MQTAVILLLLLACAGLFTLIEHGRNPARADWWINLQAWLLGTLVAINIQPLFEISGLPSLLQGPTLPFWIAFPIFVLVGDLAEYLFHRAQHRIPFLWAMHSLHHSDPEMSALTTQRHFWGDQLIKTVTVWSLAAMVTHPTPAMVWGNILLSLWNFGIHSRLRIDLGRWSWMVNAPAYHRRHHSRLPEHFDSNFAALFPIFDVIFGSYHRPEGFPPTGLDRAPRNLRDLLIWPLIWDKAETKEPAREAPALAEAPTLTEA